MIAVPFGILMFGIFGALPLLIFAWRVRRPDRARLVLRFSLALVVLWVLSTLYMTYSNHRDPQLLRHGITAGKDADDFKIQLGVTAIPMLLLLSELSRLSLKARPDAPVRRRRQVLLAIVALAVLFALFPPWRMHVPVNRSGWTTFEERNVTGFLLAPPSVPGDTTNWSSAGGVKLAWWALTIRLLVLSLVGALALVFTTLYAASPPQPVSTEGATL